MKARHTLALLGIAAAATIALGFRSTAAEEPPGGADADPVEWAIVLHGGAGKPPEGLSPERAAAFDKQVTATMRRALELGREMLASGKSSVDVVEAVVMILEEEPNLNAGRGSVLNIEGGFEMHASIMDGHTRDCGAVAAVNTIRHPISLARKVMDETDFVLLVGQGAEKFGQEIGVEIVDPDYFRTELRHESWLEAREKANLPVTEGTSDGMGRRVPDRDLYRGDMIGTVGCVALDKAGNLAAATSTGGVAHKRFGRMGDSSIIGAGNYADNDTCAVSCTGVGEHFIRNSVAFHVSALMRYKGLGVGEAAGHVTDEVLEPDTGGLIALDRHGRIAMRFNGGGMRRAAADSAGTFVVELWE